MYFLLSTIGASVGVNNIWKFPSLSFKYGGPLFIGGYIIALIIVGVPMLILEMTLGQKMQRGSAGALRGIAPRLAGAGWVASVSGMVIAVINITILGLNLYYLVISGGMPWADKTFKRPIQCDTAGNGNQTPAELFLYYEVTKALGS
jgi:SNF family Na+-dependent transporter